jgi:transposase
MEQKVATVGLDLARNVLRVHAIAPEGAVLIERKLR